MAMSSSFRRPRQRGMNIVDYLLLGLGVVCAIIGIAMFRTGNGYIFLVVSAIALYFALDGVKANWRDLAALILLLMMALLIFANLEPYAAGAVFLFGGKLPAKILSMIPLIGGLWPYLVGGLVLAPIIFLEVYPSVLKGNRESLKRTIEVLRQQQASSPADPNIPLQLAKLEEEYNNFALNTYLKFDYFRIIAYVVDAVALFIYYPPFKEGWGAFRWGWPRAEDLDWQHIGIAILILFMVQILVVGYLWIRNVNEIFVKGTKP